MLNKKVEKILSLLTSCGCLTCVISPIIAIILYHLDYVEYCAIFLCIFVISFFVSIILYSIATEQTSDLIGWFCGIVVMVIIGGIVRKCEDVTGIKFMNNTEPDYDTVYICTGRMSTHYHYYDDCIALKHCSGDIEGLSEKEAIEDGYELCEWCEDRY